LVALLGSPAATSSKGNVDVVLLQADPNDPALAPLSLRIGEAVVLYLTQAGVPTQQTPLTPEMAGHAQAEFRVAGTLHRVGDMHVVNGQVIDRASGIVLWSFRTERPVQVPGLDQRFGADLARVLKCALDERTAARKPVSNDVFALVLAMCDAVMRGEVDVLAAARRLTAAAPDMAGTYGFRALAAIFSAGITDVPEEITMYRKEAGEAIERAFALDRTEPKAHLAVADTLGSFANWGEREQHIDAALQARPDFAVALMFETMLLREVGRLKEAAAAGNRSLRLGDPRSMQNVHNVAFLNAMTGDRREVEELERRVEGLGIDFPESIAWTITVWWQDPALSLQELPALREGARSDAAANCVEVYLRRLVEARGMPIRGLPAGCEEFPQDWHIRFLARQGDVDAAYELFGKPLPNSRRTTMFLFYPEMKAFRQDKRFMPIMEQMGLLDYWRESGNWPDFCSEPDLPYDCRTYGSKAQ
jgi:hypothetical protein